MTIDLRSDTITKPTAGMLEAMVKAELGDDVFGDDPTVNALQEKVAGLLGKEAGLFVPTGTMANQIAIRCHTKPGDQIILDSNSHILHYESGGSAALSGVVTRTLPTENGLFSIDDLKGLMVEDDVHHPPNAMVSVENTHNRGGGRVWPIQGLRKVVGVCRENKLTLHMDGARLWNASVSLNQPLSELAEGFDSVSVCFSKGLGAPIGSMLTGSREMIDRALFHRKQLGGGMRQVGLLAAAANYAIDHHFKRLAEDHEHAAKLAEAIDAIDGLAVDAEAVKTNIIIFKTERHPSSVWIEALEKEGVRMLAFNHHSIRAVTNLMVKRDDIERSIEILNKIASSLK